MTLYTIGHSTLPAREFVGLLEGVGIRRLVDVRTIPKSRHNPQFWGSRLKTSLGRAGIEYLHIPELGGLRKPAPDSPNSGWRNKSFQGYADHMLTEVFAEALDRLTQLAKERPTAIMCAEAVPWRCHRNLIADALVARRRIPVLHIMTNGRLAQHRLTSWAKLRKGVLLYPESESGSEAA